MGMRAHMRAVRDLRGSARAPSHHHGTPPNSAQCNPAHAQPGVSRLSISRNWWTFTSAFASQFASKPMVEEVACLIS
jgi:hypothetical protein